MPWKIAQLSQRKGCVIMNSPFWGGRGSHLCCLCGTEREGGGRAGWICPCERRQWQSAVGCCRRGSSTQPWYLVGMQGRASSSPWCKVSEQLGAWCSFQTYLILRTLPPSLAVQILKMSSPLRTLSTTPQTSSLASANWSPTTARSRSSQ
jgi:hypothetical protein